MIDSFIRLANVLEKTMEIFCQIVLMYTIQQMETVQAGGYITKGMVHAGSMILNSRLIAEKVVYI